MAVFLEKKLWVDFSFLTLKKTNVFISKCLSEFCRKDILVNELSDQQIISDFQSENEPQEERKIVKVAVIGTPNAGKSTLINQIVGRRVFAISKKVHTTQCKARAAHVIGNTQLIFLDTPGLVTYSESLKHKLERSYMTDGEAAIEAADVVGVMHDVSNSFTRGKLDPKVLRLLHLYPKKNMVLILNKIDCLKQKRMLLDLADKLTSKQLSSVVEKNSRQSEQISEHEIERRIKKQSGWPGFQEIFMISAIEGFGVADIIDYLLKMARPGRWLFPEQEFTDQTPVRIIEDAVRSKLLDYMPQEIPYVVKVELEFLEKKEDIIVAVVLVRCSSLRIEKLIRGGKDGKIRIINKETTEDLRNTFQTDVDLRIIVTCEQNKRKS